MLAYAAAYIGGLVVFVVMDFGWLSFASERLYRPAIGDLLSPSVALIPGALFYLLYLAGVLVLAVAPGLKARSWTRTAASAAMFGLCAYATYDLTNQATLREWSTSLTLADMAWGSAVTGVAACAAFWSARAMEARL